MASNKENNFENLSNDMAAAVAGAEGAVVTVHGRRRFPSAGVYWRKGVVVTANHAVRRDEEVPVTLPGGAEASASVAGRDPSTDLAILKVRNGEAGLPEMADAAALKVGNLALALGRVDGGPRASLVAIGLLGGPWRTWYGGQLDQLIRLDREVHPTLSGGPLVDARGRVLGINTSGLSRVLGLTVPAATVNRVVDALLERGYIARGYVGLGLHSVAAPESVRENRASGKLDVSDDTCLIVLSVAADGPAAKAGVLVGDLVLALDGTAVREPEDVQELLGTERVGKTIKASILRGGVATEIPITVGEHPRA
ncbi:MAG: S1C family serine protease [Terriglobia bacterium]